MSLVNELNMVQWLQASSLSGNDEADDCLKYIEEQTRSLREKEAQVESLARQLAEARTEITLLTIREGRMQDAIAGAMEALVSSLRSEPLGARNPY